MLTILVQILLITVLILQLILAIYMLVNTHKQYKRDKAFYKQLCENLKEQQTIFLDKVEGGVQSEQSEETGDKK